MSSVEVSHNWNAEQWDWPLQHNDGVVKVNNTAEKFEVGLDAAFFTPKEIEVINNTAEKFEVGLDAAFFTPKEIEVKVNGDQLVVHFRHENRNDQHGSVAREISRTYKLPSDVDVSSLKSHLTSRGVLTITAHKKH
uniref:SHSP domain-containing protein n=1 Tax=Panagrolaimus sp. PS1159 TaxID=55785 RepID=A0AC35FZJ2_9BILA